MFEFELLLNALAGNCGSVLCCGGSATVARYPALFSEGGAICRPPEVFKEGEAGVGEGVELVEFAEFLRAGEAGELLEFEELLRTLELLEFGRLFESRAGGESEFALLGGLGISERFDGGALLQFFKDLIDFEQDS